MRNFSFHRPTTLSDAVAALAAHDGWQVLAGGTTVVDLVKLDVMTPEGLVDITGSAELQGHEVGDRQLRFGFLARMADVADDKALKDTVKDARIALGGVATRPWRAKAAEDVMRPTSCRPACCTARSRFRRSRSARLTPSTSARPRPSPA